MAAEWLPAVLAALPPTIAAITGLVLAVRKLDGIHHQMNSRMDELVAASSRAAGLAGEERGRERWQPSARPDHGVEDGG